MAQRVLHHLWLVSTMIKILLCVMAQCLRQERERSIRKISYLEKYFPSLVQSVRVSARRHRIKIERSSATTVIQSEPPILAGNVQPSPKQIKVVTEDSSAGSCMFLADVSSELGKRKFVSLSCDSVPNGEDGNQNDKNNEMKRSDLAPSVSCEGSENFLKLKREFEVDGKGDFPLVNSAIKPCGSLNLCMKAEPRQDKPDLDILRIPRGTMEISGFFDTNLPFVRRDFMKQSVAKTDYDILKNNSTTGVILERQCDITENSPSVTNGRECHGVGTSSVGNPIGNNAVNRVVTNVCENDGDRWDFVALTSDTFASNGCPIPSGPSGSQARASQTCADFNGAGVMDTGGANLLNSCSCSFCCKAAFIWSDLHYQDAKSRIAAIKKIRKSVKTIVERHYSHGDANRNAQGNVDKCMKLENDPVGQWRSLFIHTDNVLACESNQLQTSLLSLKRLRDDCKVDLEAIDSTNANV